MIGVTKLHAGVGNVGLAERPERDPGAGEVRLAVLGAGVCGTDLHIEADEFRSAPPVTMGHEVCGRVDAVGEDVSSTWAGTRVVSETYASTCGRAPGVSTGDPTSVPSVARSARLPTAPSLRS